MLAHYETPPVPRQWRPSGRVLRCSRANEAGSAAMPDCDMCDCRALDWIDLDVYQSVIWHHGQASTNTATATLAGLACLGG